MILLVPWVLMGCARFAPPPVVSVGGYTHLEPPAAQAEPVEEMSCEAAVQVALNRNGLTDYEQAQKTASQRRRTAKNPAGEWEMRLRQELDGPGPDEGNFVRNGRATVRWTPEPLGLAASREYRETQRQEARQQAIKETRATLAAQVRRDYLRVRSARLAVEIATRRLAIDTEHRDLQRIALGVGAITGSQMEEADLEYQASLEALNLAELTLTTRIHGFKTRYGHAPSKAACDTTIHQRPLSEHPQVQRRQAEANASHAMAEWSEQQPEFKVSFLEIGYHRREADNADRVLVELGIPLWDGSEADAQRARADAHQDRARVQWEAQTVRENVLNNRVRLREEEATLHFLQEQSKNESAIPKAGSPQLRIKRLRHQLKAYAQRENQVLKVDAARIDLRESLGQP